MSDNAAYRALPSVDSLIDRFEGRLPRPLVADVARSVLEQARVDITEGREADVEPELARLLRAIERSAGTLVINATGVLLHTNLGRARWSERAARAATQAATEHTNVELDVESGERGKRGSYVAGLVRALTGAEDAMVVNNNASALLLALAATSSGRAVLVARGELIEIGGSYRLPEVMEASGARLIEVGTTNRTRIGDYETATQLHDCGAILKVHPSNYRVEGFTSEVVVGELSGLAKERSLPLIYDIGSGLLDAETPWIEGAPPPWLRGEPAARQALADGADLVTFSGDKLLGGPQAGIVVGSGEAVARLRGHPLTRALRIDAVTIAGLTETLDAYARGEAISLPFWRQALADPSEIERRAESMAEALAVRTAAGQSQVGAGSVPGMAVPTTLVVLPGEDHLFHELLAAEHPILARREEGALVLDVRTIDPERDKEVVETVTRCR